MAVERSSSTGTAAVGAWCPALTPPTHLATSKGWQPNRPPMSGLWVATTIVAAALIRRWRSTGTAAVAAHAVWAVGDYYSSSGSVQTLVEHWNGSTWSTVPSPNPGMGYNYLSGVGAVSAHDVWAVGNYAAGSSGADQTLAEHWNGS